MTKWKNSRGHVQRIHRLLVKTFDRVAAHTAAAVLLCGLLGFLAPMAYGLFRGRPIPRVHDEFSYLLAADTFCRGRAANPTHPMWRHFESPHILQIPTYMSKYPPGQGLVLAAGKHIFGHPCYGIWMSVGFAAAVVCWMLQAWTRPRWALLATLLMILWIGVQGHWAQTYWGGFVAAAGGALFLGGFRRAVVQTSVVHAVLMATGLAVMAISRPYEGAAFALPAMVAFAVWIFRDGTSDALRKVLMVVVPLVLVGGPSVAAMLWYNHEITGCSHRLPYQIHQEQYFRAPLLLFQAPHEPTLGHDRLRQFYDDQAQVDLSLGRLLALPFHRMIRQACFFFPVCIAVVFIPLLCATDRWLWFAAFTWLILLGAQTLVAFNYYPHYAAPITCLLYLFCAEALRRVRTLVGRGGLVPRFRATYVVAIVLVAAMVDLGDDFRHRREPSPPDEISAGGALWHSGHFLTREAVRKWLQRQPGQDLVIVQYHDDYSLHREWVYNGATIDEADVVWAHDLGDEPNRRLLEYYDERRVWRVMVRDNRVTLAELPPERHRGEGK